MLYLYFSLLDSFLMYNSESYYSQFFSIKSKYCVVELKFKKEVFVDNLIDQLRNVEEDLIQMREINYFFGLK